jgi:C4-dicarboxylate-specific signal transduction histidine kinase
LSEDKAKSAGSDTILNQLMEIARISALAEMASGIAHELNQPLGAIATFSQAGERMLNRPEPLVSRALDVFRLINNEALGAGDGIRRIRRLFDQEEATRVRCQMSALVTELMPVLEMLAGRVKGRLQVDTPPALPDLLIDRLRIQHVLFALVQNAFEANAERPAGARLVKVTMDGDRYTVRTSVIDSGPGVPAEILGQLFHPFFTTKPRGTGLGLASSRAIIEAHEGTIGFEDLSARGSRFWFRLPAAGT